MRRSGTYRWYPTATVLATPDEIAVPGGTFHAEGKLVCQQGPSAAVQEDEECACVQEAGDFYFDLGICGASGFCLPNDDLNASLPYEPCAWVEVPTQGLDLGTRVAVDEIEWQEYATNAFFGSYPQMFVVPDLPHFASSGSHLGGTLVKVGAEQHWDPGTSALVWDPAAPEAPIQEIGGPSCTRGSSAVMYASDKIMKFGGVTAEGTSRMTEILDLSTACPQWRRPQGSELGMPRHYSGGVLLPDGNVLATGGSLGNANVGDTDLDPGDGFNDQEYTVFTTELFDRDTETWCRVADLPGTSPGNPPVYRGYHAQSFLLPDGRVYLGAGGGQGGTVVDHFDYMLFAPPYLFWGARPEIDFGPGVSVVGDIGVMSTGGGTFVLTEDESVVVDRVTMVKLSASTHQFDQEQRFVELQILPEDEENELHVATPPSTCYATPGYYMLFAISSAGVPSIGRYVSVSGSCVEAEEPAVAPLHPSPTPAALNDLHASGTPGLRASCAGGGSTLSLADLRRSAHDLCDASGACPQDADIAIEARFVSSTGQVSVDPEDLLDEAMIYARPGNAPFLVDPLVLDVAGTEHDTHIDLGPGDHVIELCGGFGAFSACIEQALRIDPVLAGDDESEYRAGTIEPRPLHLVDLLDDPGLPLGDDGVVEVQLPEGFVFPFFGEEVRAVWIGANGAIRIDEGTVPAASEDLPFTGGPQIAVYWDDLDPSEGGRVLTYYDGVRFVVAWEGVAHALGGFVDAQAHLFADGRIELHYGSTSTGPRPDGVNATIGIQHDGDALVLSHQDDELLGGARAFAIDTTTCIASALRLPDSTPCRDRVAVAPLDVAICSGNAPAMIARPTVSTVCAPHDDAVVLGDVRLGSERQPVADDGAIDLFVGDYVARWTMHAPMHGAAGMTYVPQGEPAQQAIEVRVHDMAEVCCRDDQTIVTLTAAANRHLASQSVANCVAAQGGDDDIGGGPYDDTLLGQPGNDKLQGGGGDDILLGGFGDDELLGQADDDELLGGPGADELLGGPGSDVLWGGLGDDELLGGDGADTLIPGPGVDIADGGSGDDAIVVLDVCEIQAGDVLDGGDGDDTLWLPAGVTVGDLQTLGATVSNFEAVETITGGAWGQAECTLNP